MKGIFRISMDFFVFAADSQNPFAFKIEEHENPEWFELRDITRPDDREKFLNYEIRPVRNRLLDDSDIKVLPDSPMTSEKRAQWETYRQALRDFPANLDLDAYDLIKEIVWPSKPEE